MKDHRSSLPGPLQNWLLRDDSLNNQQMVIHQRAQALARLLPLHIHTCETIVTVLDDDEYAAFMAYLAPETPSFPLRQRLSAWIRNLFRR